MGHFHPLRFLAVVAVLVLATSCNGAASPASTTTSTRAPSTTAADDATTSTTTVAVAPTTETGVDPGVDQQLRENIAALVGIAEDLRGLDFIEEPDVVILPPDDFAERVAADLAEDLDPDELEADELFYELMGMLDGRTDLRELLVALYEEQALGFYDGRTAELVIAGDAAELSPYRKSVLVHELLHALTDQHFRYSPVLEQLIDEERDDEAAALRALVEGDATFYQLVYVQSLTAAELSDLAAEQAAVDVRVFASSPSFVQESLLFPYEEGYPFVAQLVASGGADAVNRAYRNPPTTTEVILHPERYVGAEAAQLVVSPQLTAPGYATAEQGVFGEWATRLVLRSGVTRGEASQAADGWGGDWYQLLVDLDDDDVVFVWDYVGDSERDAVELVEALIAHVERQLELGEAVAEAGGVLYTTEDRYVFIDRTGDRVVYVATTDPSIGETVRLQMQS